LFKSNIAPLDPLSPKTLP